MADRTVTIPGEWAEGAADAPGSPSAGTTYRDSTLIEATMIDAWPYSQVADSATFNEVMARVTNLLRSIEEWGILPWAATTTYDVGAKVMGSDGKIYKSIVAANINFQPTSEPTKWKYELTHDHSDADNGGPISFIPSGTKMVFFQAAAPTGWTKDVSQNDKALRVVSGAGGGTGGTLAFSSATVSNHTLTGSQMPAHVHGVGSIDQRNQTGGGDKPFAAGDVSSTSSGLGNAHNHGLDLEYIDIIVCTKD